MAEKRKRYRLVSGKKLVVQHEFHGTRSIPEAMEPFILDELHRMQQDAQERLKQKPDGDSVAGK